VVHKLKKIYHMVTNAIALMNEEEREAESKRFFIFNIIPEV